jgi:hypothetical protein
MPITREERKGLVALILAYGNRRYTQGQAYYMTEVKIVAETRAQEAAAALDAELDRLTEREAVADGH